MQTHAYSSVKYRAAPADGMWAPVGAAPAPAAAGTEFVWHRAERASAAVECAPICSPAPSAAPGSRLAAAAELARRCVELGVRPPLRPVSVAPQAQQQQHPQQLQHPLPPASQLPDRLELLADQVQQQGSVLASAVQGQCRQLAAQQQLLADVVQGLLYVGAKSGSKQASGSTHHTAAATQALSGPGSRQAAAATPPRRAAAQAQGLAARLLPTAGRGRFEEAAPWAVSPGGSDGGCDGNRSSPYGVLRVPAMLGIGAEPGSLVGEEVSDVSSPEQRQQAVAAAVAAASRRQLSQSADSGGADRAGQTRVPLSLQPAGGGSRPHSRPAWNDRTVVASEQHQVSGRRPTEAQPAPPPGRHLVGGIGPHLLLLELRRLQRRRTTSGSGGGSGTGTGAAGAAKRGLQDRFQQAGRPATAPASSKPRLELTAGNERLQRAKRAAVMGLARRGVPTGHGSAGRRMGIDVPPNQSAEGAVPAAMPPGLPVKGVSFKGAAAARPTAAARREAVEISWQQQEERQQQQERRRQKEASLPELACLLAGDEEAHLWEQLSEADVEAVCERICRQLLLSECSPCSAPVPAF